MGLHPKGGFYKLVQWQTERTGNHHERPKIWFQVGNRVTLDKNKGVSQLGFEKNIILFVFDNFNGNLP